MKNSKSLKLKLKLLNFKSFLQSVSCVTVEKKFNKTLASMFSCAEPFCEFSTTTNSYSCRTKQKPHSPLSSGIKSSSGVLQVSVAVHPSACVGLCLMFHASQIFYHQTSLLLYSNCELQFPVLNISLRCHFLLLLLLGPILSAASLFLFEDISRCIFVPKSCVLEKNMWFKIQFKNCIEMFSHVVNNIDISICNRTEKNTWNPGVYTSKHE